MGTENRRIPVAIIPRRIGNATATYLFLLIAALRLKINE